MPEPDTEQTAGKQGDEAKETAGLDILDFLFTFVLAFGLIPEVFGEERFRGMLSEAWVSPLRWPSLTEWGHLLLLFQAS